MPLSLGKCNSASDEVIVRLPGADASRMDLAAFENALKQYANISLARVRASVAKKSNERRGQGGRGALAKKRAQSTD